MTCGGMADRVDPQGQDRKLLKRVSGTRNSDIDFVRFFLLGGIIDYRVYYLSPVAAGALSSHT